MLVAGTGPYRSNTLLVGVALTEAGWLTEWLMWKLTGEVGWGFSNLGAVVATT